MNCNREYPVFQYLVPGTEYRLDDPGNPVGLSVVKGFPGRDSDAISGSLLTGTGYSVLQYPVLQ